MRQAPNGKRSRNRPGRGGNRPQQSRNHSYDSNGPEGKVRGTANQVYDKYLALARDASSSGDRVMAENYFQHAEHYFRIMNVNGQQVRPRQEFMEDGADQAGEVSGNANPSSQSQPVVHLAGNGSGNSAAADPREAAIEPAFQPADEGQPKTPAELAQAAAANSDERSKRGRRPRRGNVTADP